ncbi:MAG: response regulator [Thermodesulfobacteriota bacterium]
MGKQCSGDELSEDMMETGKRELILLVDDRPVNLKVLFSFLKEQDFDVRILESGEQALEVLKHTLPDLILLDVMMPGLNGFETCAEIKGNEKTAHIPVIFITALDGTQDKIAGFEVGGADYITKPFHQAEVLARVNTHLNLVRKQRKLELALAEIKTLTGILPICSHCKKIRDDAGYWQQVEQYISENSEAMFSHGICEECLDKHYGDFLQKIDDEN